MKSRKSNNKNKIKKNRLRFPIRLGTSGRPAHEHLQLSLHELRTSYKIITGNESFDGEKNRNIIPIVFPKKLQREYGAWSSDDKSSFLFSLVCETADLSTAILVSVEEVRDFCSLPRNITRAKELASTPAMAEEMEKHFKDTECLMEKLLKSYGPRVMLCIEGQHRLRTIQEFIQDGQIAYTGDFWSHNHDGELVLDSLYNKFWHQIGRDDQEFFLKNTYLNFAVIKKATNYFLSRTFVDVNSSKPPNKQQRRNASVFPIAQSVKDISHHDRGLDHSLFNTLFTKRELNHAAAEEFVAYLFEWNWKEEYGTPITPEKLDELYEVINSKVDDETYEKVIVESVRDDVDFLRNCVSSSGTTETKGFAIGLLLAKQVLLDLGYEISDTKHFEFAEEFEKLNKSLRDLSLASFSAGDNISDTYYYWSEKSVVTKTSLSNRKSSLVTPIKELIPKLEDEKIVERFDYDQEILAAE
tara:strand:+ start:3028 stop:4437 length:1410 start_codon:yes stop_codon:yes gene_type:complete